MNAQYALTHFVNDDGYLRWLAQNPNGFVVNSNRVPVSSYLILHRAFRQRRRLSPLARSEPKRLRRQLKPSPGGQLSDPAPGFLQLDQHLITD